MAAPSTASPTASPTRTSTPGATTRRQSDPDAVYAAEINLDLGQVTPHISGPHSVQVMTSLAEMDQQQDGHPQGLPGVLHQQPPGRPRAGGRGGRRRQARWPTGVEFYVAAASQPIEEQAKASGAWQKLLDAGARPLPPGCGPCIGLGVGLLEDGEVGISATNRNFKGRMGSRDAEAYLASPAVVAASALAGYITGPDGHGLAGRACRTATSANSPAAGGAAGDVEILDGFPAGLEGRVLFLPHGQPQHRRHLRQGLHLPRGHHPREDGRGGDGELRSRVRRPGRPGRHPGRRLQLRHRQQPRAGRHRPAGRGHQAGDRRQLLADLPAQRHQQRLHLRGVPRAERRHARPTSPTGQTSRTIIGDDPLALDFARSAITWRGDEYRFTPLGKPVQEVVIAGGVENQVRASLA